MNWAKWTGLVARKNRQRLDSTQMLGRVSRMNRLDCVRETLRLALQELKERAAADQLPPWWSRLWERYVETQTDYRASLETFTRKLVEAGADAQQLLAWLDTEAGRPLAGGAQSQLLGRVFAEQFELTEKGEALLRNKQELDSERVQNPHDPDATYAAKGQGEQKKEHVGYKVQVAETSSKCERVPARSEMRSLSAYRCARADLQSAPAESKNGFMRPRRRPYRWGSVIYRPTPLFAEKFFLNGEPWPSHTGSRSKLHATHTVFSITLYRCSNSC